MQFKKVLFPAFILPLILSSCGGSNSQPYDGNWTGIYISPDITSTFSTTQTKVCNTVPAALVIDKAKGTATQYTTCTTTLIDGNGVQTIYAPQTFAYFISINIEASKIAGNKDVLNAIVNGVSYTGECISTIACSAESVTSSLSFTR